MILQELNNPPSKFKALPTCLVTCFPHQGATTAKIVWENQD